MFGAVVFILALVVILCVFAWLLDLGAPRRKDES